MKRLVAIVLILIILASLAACGSEPQMSCGECGKSVSANTAFCEYCGAKLSANDGAGSSTTEDISTTNNNKQDLVDSNYEEYLTLIEAGQYEEAYKKLNELEDKGTADELRAKFIIIENVLVNQTLNKIEDELGNVIAPVGINFKYDIYGNLVEIEAGGDSTLASWNTFNPFMQYVAKINYTPYLEKLSYSEGKMIKVTGYNRASDKILYTADFSYDENGNIAKVKYICNNGSAETLYKYNENNQLIQVERVWENSFGDNISNIQYNDDGNPIEEGTVYDNYGRITESKGYHYHFIDGMFAETKITWNYGDFYIYIG